MMRVWPVAVVLAVLVPALAAGCTRQAPSGGRQIDPAVRAASAVTGLERTEVPVTKEQATKLLPLFRALQGTPAEDRPAVAALVREIDGILTDGQRTALRRLREERRPGRPGAPDAPPDRRSGPGASGPRGQGQFSPERMAAFRGQILDRAITVLEGHAL